MINNKAELVMVMANTDYVPDYILNIDSGDESISLR